MSKVSYHGVTLVTEFTVLALEGQLSKAQHALLDIARLASQEPPQELVEVAALGQTGSLAMWLAEQRIVIKRTALAALEAAKGK